MKITVIKFFLIGCVLLATKASMAQIVGIKTLGDTCELTLAMQAAGTSSSPYFSWNFGDPASGSNDTITIFGGSSISNPTHTFSAPGVYRVCVTFQEPTFPPTTICRTLSVGLCCNGTINSSDTCLSSNISFSITTGAIISSVTWNFGDPSSGANNTSTSITPNHTFSGVGTYNVRADVVATCGNFSINYPINIVNCTTQPCTGEIIFQDSCLQNGSRFSITSNNTISSVNWLFDDPSSGVNNTSASLNPIHFFTSSRSYFIRAIVTFSCGTDTLFKSVNIEDCDTNKKSCELFIPNVFTPNNDGVNDSYAVETACKTDYFELHIYNRWGQSVFETKNPNEKWNGKSDGVDCPEGVYVCVLSYIFPNQSKKSTYSTISLIR